LIEEGKSAFQLVRNQGIFWIASLILIALIYKLKLGPSSIKDALVVEYTTISPKIDKRK